LKSKKTLSDWLSNRYLLILRNEENFAERTTISFTYAKLIVFSVSIFLIVLMISLYLVTTILSAWLDPRHAEVEANRQLIELSQQLDSLALEIDRKEMFIASFRRLASGEVANDTFNTLQANAGRQAANGKDLIAEDLPAIDSALRSEFEGSLLYDRVASGGGSEMQEIFFFSPIEGIVSAPFDSKIEHYGVDIVAKQNEPVKAVADGTVLLSSWTQKEGYVLAVQHRTNLVSVYKHNSALLKKTGEFVRAGEVISIIGNSGELTTGPHLHLELWYNGNPVNPEEFVSF
jgi:murein DD-endopeptidase MepM/ murein hydrolase activator NlpD